MSLCLLQDGTEMKAFVAESQSEVVAVAIIRVEEVSIQIAHNRTCFFQMMQHEFV